ncbi:ABC transporter permease [Vibrio diabolicus]|jgi:putative spermidine/putrescine transport system permease protein|uniref:ABC transporter permease n=1 Tax=Vibrio diabolicus subgroup TaxID=2315253 RepID=UPI00211B1A2B|nr:MULTISPECIES: ABC transporter permease [Vibrio diabolicus subgroup]MCG9228885.1 ABC transporter permease [Vibrio diabolicus]MCG9571316.1 ABC transporter permease [Vibrio diabolicus]MCG9593154.1 ABC transporter permease [Vibrio diabolicus]MCR9846482.1 ABC transporter permease [Vibrio antiquarius]MCR9915513.1 ABC transporter permease [Vibrio antiquarius]
MSRELTTLDSVLKVERQVHQQETNLKAQLQKAERRKKLRSIMLTIPLVCFILFTFAFPILDMLYRSVDNREISQSLPQTIQALESWDYQGQPHQEVIEAFSVEVLALYQSKELPKIASRMNIEVSGMRSLLMKTGRKLSRLASLPSSVTQLAKLDKRWANPKYWAAFKNLSGALTFSHYLAALDLQVNEFGDIEPQPEKRQIYVDLFFKTFWMSISITLICLVMAYPVAYLLANLPDKRANLLLIIVLLPFWTSLLVRTTSWIVLLQNQGVINDLLIWSGFTSERIQMIHNTFGTVVSMVHILLPFMILPLYSVMKGISPTYFRAARSLGATPFIAFIKVYMPLTLPGIGAGALLTFILSIGFYITPALVGGRSGQMISNMIAYHMQTSLNWGMAGALGGLLLFVVLVLFYMFNRVVGINNLKVGG